MKRPAIATTAMLMVQKRAIRNELRCRQAASHFFEKLYN